MFHDQSILPKNKGVKLLTRTVTHLVLFLPTTSKHQDTICAIHAIHYMVSDICSTLECYILVHWLPATSASDKPAFRQFRQFLASPERNGISYNKIFRFDRQYSGYIGNILRLDMSRKNKILQILISTISTFLN